MQDKIESILREQCKLDREKPILVGVSGGPDSLCLLSLLHEGGWKVIAAHFNHMLRPEAGEDAAAVKAIALRLGIPCVGGQGDVRQYAAEKKLSIETAARELRYRFLFAEAHERAAQAVAVGHTADDQVETVLMHVIRGAGLNGLKGMPYRTVLEEYKAKSDARDIPLVRPLLDVWRDETVVYCESHGLQARYDESNNSLDFLRNRVRHELIPALETYNPRFREAVWRSGRTLSADYDVLNAALEPLWQRAALRVADKYVGLDLPALGAQPPGVQMHLFRRAVQALLPGYDTGYDDLQRAVAFLGDPTQERADFVGGLLLLRETDVLYVTATERSLPFDQWPQMPAGADSISFSAPIRTALDAGWQFTADRCNAAELDLTQPWSEADPFVAILDTRDLQAHLELRVRREGDRFEPLGMGAHSQKVSDFFVNVKLPRRARGRWPLVCAGHQVIWVPGYRPAEPYRLRAGTTEVLRLAMIRPK